jgi:DNA-binding GntR family transcriptional regulator
VISSYKMTSRPQDELTTPSLRVAARVPAPVRDEVVARLRQAILDQRFAVGERLIERELCEATGVSRTSIREALRQLEAEGLVTTVPQRGVVVARVSPRAAAEMYYVRELLEAPTAAQFARVATDEQVAEVQAALEAVAEATSSGDLARMLTARAEFYGLIIRGAGNETVADILRSLHARITVLRATSMSDPDRPAVSLAEMREIVDAVVARDGERATRAYAQHVRNAATCALTLMQDTTTTTGEAL